MKILFATDQYLPTPGGISVVTERLTHALSEKGHSVAIIAPSTSWKFRRETKNGITIYRMQSILVHKAKQIRFSPKFFYKKKIEYIVDTFKPDIVHIETPNDIASTTVEVAKKRNIPIIATCHIMPENISGALPFLPSQIGKMFGNLYMKQLIQVFNKVDFVTAPTMTGIAILRAHEIKPQTEAVSNGIDLQQFAIPPKEQQEVLREKYHLPTVPIVLYIGRLDKEKRVEILIESLSYLKNTIQFHVVIAGKGEEMKELLELVQKLGMVDRVSFIGFVEESDLPKLYALASVFVMPSTAELQSLVTMEAMALGLPVIGARAGALPYLIKPNQNGFLFEPDNPEDLAKKLQLILEDKTVQRSMGKQSLELIKEHDIRHIVKEMESLYMKIIAAKQGEISQAVTETHSPL